MCVLSTGIVEQQNKFFISYFPTLAQSFHQFVFVNFTSLLQPFFRKNNIRFISSANNKEVINISMKNSGKSSIPNDIEKAQLPA